VGPLVGHDEAEGRALAEAGVDPHLALVVRGDVADDGQAEPGASGGRLRALVDPVEPLEDPLEVGLGDADAVGPAPASTTFDPSESTRTWTSSPSSEYFTALSSRL
jgi:hypothetical protein